MPIKLNKGLNLQIAGASQAKLGGSVAVGCCALVPDDFSGFQARPAVKEGDHLAVGDAVAYDKLHPELKLVSPVAGTLKSIVRGERRKILRFEIEADGSDNVKTATVPQNPDCAKAISLLAESGLLAFVRTRPYDIVPDPTVVPRDIFVSCIDSAPLAVSAVALTAGEASDSIKKGVKLLKAATAGKVYLCVGKDWPYGKIEGAELVEFDGKHPVGNPSVQIEAVAPVNKGDLVWTLSFDTLCRVGHFNATGKFDPSTLVAVVGPDELVSAIESIRIPASALDLEGASGDKLISVDVEDYLPDKDRMSIPWNSQVNVTLLVRQLSQRVIEVPTNGLSGRGSRDQNYYEYSLDSIEVTVEGLSEDLELLNVADIVLEMDVSGMGVGNYSGNLTFKGLRDNFSVVGYSDFQVMVRSKETGPGMEAAVRETREQPGDGQRAFGSQGGFRERHIGQRECTRAFGDDFCRTGPGGKRREQPGGHAITEGQYG